MEERLSRDTVSCLEAMELAIRLRKDGYTQAARFLEREASERAWRQISDPEWRPA